MNTIIVLVVLALLATLAILVTAAKAVPELPPEPKLTEKETREAWQIIKFVLLQVSTTRNLVVMAHTAGCFPLSKKLHNGDLVFSHLCGVTSFQRPNWSTVGMVLLDRDGKEALTLGFSLIRDSYGDRMIRLVYGCSEA
jgi:hypothetical protein